MPKKTKPNGFLILMLDYVEEQRKKGRNINMAVAQKECDGTWKVSIFFEDLKSLIIGNIC